MKNKFTILGCGSSLGSPWITGNWGSCDKKNSKNVRTRCSAHIKFKNLSILQNIKAVSIIRPFCLNKIYLYADKTACPLEPALPDHSLAIVAPTFSK